MLKHILIIITFSLSCLLTVYANDEIANSEESVSSETTAANQPCNPVTINGEFEAKVIDRITLHKDINTGRFIYSKSNIYTKKNLLGNDYVADDETYISTKSNKAENSVSKSIPAGGVVKFDSYSSKRHANGRRYTYKFTYKNRKFTYGCEQSLCANELGSMFANDCSLNSEF